VGGDDAGGLDPEDTGPIVINGAPMSYWGGAWQEAKATIRCATRAACWAARGSRRCVRLGDGVFDGAYLVENFENLNPANTFWDKYYHLYANVDTERRASSSSSAGGAGST
jgi:hypothetical protein